MLVKRIVSSVVLIGMVTALLLIDWVCALAVTLFIVAGLYEFFKMLDRKGIRAYKYFGIIVGTMIPVSLLLRFESTRNWELLFIVLGLFFLILMQFKRRESSGVIVDISTTIFGVFYVSWLFSFLIKIRYLPGGLGLLATVLLITKLGDIGAYLIGMRFGKTPLIPRISPKKSIEGSVGGLLFSVLGALVSGAFLNFNWLHLIMLGVFLGSLGQMGDLSESLIKRDCHVKDSGVIFPGIGGVLDAIDSLLFTAPAFYFYMQIIPK